MQQHKVHYKNPLSHTYFMCGLKEDNAESTNLISKTTCSHCLYGLQSRGYIEHNDNKEYITWEMFGRAIKVLAQKIRNDPNFERFKRIYGIPRGGVVVAIALAHQLDLKVELEPRRSDECGVSDLLIVDDIVDTGKTISKYGNLMKVSLYYNIRSTVKPNYHIYTTDKFIVFPWETPYTAKIDYLENTGENNADK